MLTKNLPDSISLSVSEVWAESDMKGLLQVLEEV